MLQLNSQNAKAFAAVLDAGLRAALDRAWLALDAWGREWQSRVERATPVARGLAQRSWSLRSERSATAMSVTLANSAHSERSGACYPLFLELGTDRIASGQVKAWQPGEPAVAAWPASSHGPTLSPNIGDRSRYVDVISHAFSGNPDARMPILRPIGYELAPQILGDVQNALVQGFQSAFEAVARAE